MVSPCGQREPASWSDFHTFLGFSQTYTSLALSFGSGILAVMLGNRQQLNALNQENPQQQRALSTKTPLRQGLTTVRKPLGGLRQTTARSTRVLGQKDGNIGKTSTASLLFTAPSKPSTSCALTTSNPTVAHSPLSSQSLHLPAHLRTPSPNVHKFASFSLSPGLDEEVETEQSEELVEEIGDREVEIAGKSSRDYDELYVPDFALPDFKTAGYGRLLRSVPMIPCDDDFEVRDQDERKQIQATFPVERIVLKVVKPYTAFAFPVPKRVALSSKSSNSILVASTRAPVASIRKPLTVNQATPAISRRASTLSSSTASKSSATSTVASSKPKWGAPVSRVEPVKAARSISIGPRLSLIPPGIRSVGPSRSATPAGGAKSSSSLATLIEPDRSLAGSAEEEAELGVFGIDGFGDELVDFVDFVVDEPFCFEDGA